MTIRTLSATIAVVSLLGAPGRSGEPSASSPTAASGFRIEHFAFNAGGFLYLDGPRLEASCPGGRSGAGLHDDDGNVWFGEGGDMWHRISGRCLEKESGAISPNFGNDYWTSDFGVDEGPGSAMPIPTGKSNLGPPNENCFVWGAPMRAGGKGFLIFSDGRAVRKVFRNPDRDNRWWFQRIIGGGKTQLPTAAGGRVPALEAEVDIQQLQVMPDGRIVIYSKGGFYEYRDKELVCLLGNDDYRGLGVFPDKQGNPWGTSPGGKQEVPRLGVVGGDGTFYLGTYFGSGYAGKTPSVWRVVPGGKLEPYAWALSHAHLDGPAMASGAGCGHHIWARMHNFRYVPADCLFIIAHDNFEIRRIRASRVSTLCRDGEWRELTPATFKPNHFPVQVTSTWAPGPDGVLTFGGENGEANTYSGAVTYVVRGVDFSKPTIGPLMEAAVPSWPPKAADRTSEQSERESRNSKQSAASEGISGAGDGR